MRRASIIILALILAAVFAPHGATAPDKRIVIVVFDLAGVNTEPGVAETLTETLREILFNTGKYKIVDRSMLDRVMKEVTLGQSGLASDDVAKIGKMTSAKKIIIGKITRMGTIYMLSLTMIDIESTQSENIITERCPRCSQEQLFDLVGAGVVKLLGGQGTPIPNPPPINNQPPPNNTVQPPITPPPTQPGGNAKQIYDQASNENDINRRVQLYLQSIQTDPNYAPAHNDLGVDYIDLNRWEDAKREFEIALRLDPNHTFAHNNLGLCYMNIQPPRYSDAIAEFQAALRLNPNYANAHLNLGKAYYRLQRYPDALPEFQTAGRLNPKSASAQYYTGLTYKQMKQYNEAIAAFRKCLDIDPKFSDAYYQSGATYLAMKSYDDAIKSYQKCLEIDTEYIDAYYDMGITYAAMNDKKAAIYYFQKYIQKETRPSEAQWVEKARQKIQQLQSAP